GAIRQLHQPRDERFAVERLELVEERQQQHRRQLHEADHDNREDGRRRDPPPIGIPADERADDQRRGQPEHQRHESRLGVIEPPPRGGLRGQAITPFERHALVEREGQADRLVDEREQDDVDRERQHERRAGERRGVGAQRGGRAAEDEREQQTDTEDRAGDGGAAAQAVVAGGFVFVHGSGRPRGRPLRPTLASSSGASISSSRQNGLGLYLKIANISAMAVSAFSPPESSCTLCSRLPGGDATISMPLSSGSFSSRRVSPARPPPKSVLKVTWKFSWMAVNASRNRLLVVSSIRLIASDVWAIDSTRSFRCVVRNVWRVSSSSNCSIAIMFTGPSRSIFSRSRTM